MTESGKVVLQYCIIEFDEKQVWLIAFVVILNPCKVIMCLFKFWPKKDQKVIITLQGLRIKTNVINQTCFSLKSMMQYCKTTFPDSVIFNEKNLVENRSQWKMRFSWGKLIWSSGPRAQCRFGCWQPMHTQRVTDGMVNSSSAGWARKLTETRAVARLITAMTRNVTLGTGIQARVTQSETGSWTRIKQEIKFIEPRDAACTPLSYKLLCNLLFRSCNHVI